MNYTASEWMTVLTFGILLGAAGQMMRVVAGMKKLSESSAAQGKTLSDCFSPSQMVVSLLIGGVAGLLGAIALGLDPKQAIPPDKITALLGVGYAGADFVEAFMSKASSASQSALALVRVPAPTSSPAPVSVVVSSPASVQGTPAVG